MTILIETDIDIDGTPIYGKTLRQAIGEIMETDTVRRDAKVDQRAAELSDAIGRRVTNDIGMESVMMSDAFFNCNLINDLEWDQQNGEYIGLAAAAVKFNAELIEPFRSRYTVKWLIQDFYNRV